MTTPRSARLVHWAAALTLGLGLAGCASGGDDGTGAGASGGTGGSGGSGGQVTPGGPELGGPTIVRPPRGTGGGGSGGSTSVPVLGGVHPEVGNPIEELAEGASDFFREAGGTTQVPGGDSGGRGETAGGAAGGVDSDTAAPSAPPSDGGAQAPSNEPRLVEESDIYKIVGHHLFVLNQWRGLQIIDLSEPDAPRLVARVPITGNPVEMYVRDGNAYVLVSDYFTWWRSDEDSDEDVPFRGSQLAIIDVRDPASPRWLGGVDLDGFVSDTRIVGSVMYLVANRYSWWGYPGYGTGDNEDATVVVSVDISDPAAVREVERLSFPRENGWNQHLNVTDRALIIGSVAWNWGGDSNVVPLGETAPINGPYTMVQTVDITDPAGHLTAGARFVVPGQIQDRWNMDLHGDDFRIVSTPNGGWGVGGQLRTYSMATPGEVQFLAEVDLPARDSVTASRFDGDRGYMLTYERPVRLDPLITVDLSDAVHPRVMGELHMPGWIDYVEPRGDRLVTLGHDDDGRKLAVGLYDVSDLAHPRELSRLVFGGEWSNTPANFERDDFQKVFKVLDDLGLVLVPYQAWRANDARFYRYEFVGAVQIIDYSRDGLTLRGEIDGAGQVQRATPYGDRVVTLSTTTMQVVDVTDRDAPAVKAALDLSRNVTRIGFAGDAAIELVPPDWYSGNGRLVGTPLADPDTPSPLASAELRGTPATMVAGGERVHVVELDRDTGLPRLVSFRAARDDAGALALTRAGSLELPWAGYGWGGWWIDYAFERAPYYYGSFGRALLAGDDTVVLAQSFYGGWPTDPLGRAVTCLDCAEGEVPSDVNTAGGARWWNRFLVVNVSDVDHPSLSAQFTLAHARFVHGLAVRGTQLLFSHEEETREEGRRVVRSYLDRVELADATAPVALPKVNIPGHLVDLSDAGRYVFTVEADTRGFTPKTTFYALALVGDHAYLRGRTSVDGIAEGAVLRGGVVYLPAGLSRSWFDGAGGGTQRTQSALQLRMIDARIVRDLRDAGELRFITGTQPGRLVAVERGRAIFQVGYDQVVVYDVSDPQAPVLHDALRTGSYVQQVAAFGDRAYISSGPYGVATIDLAPLAPPPTPEAPVSP